MKTIAKLIYQLLQLQSEKLARILEVVEDTNESIQDLVTSLARSSDDQERFRQTTNERIRALEEKRHG